MKVFEHGLAIAGMTREAVWKELELLLRHPQLVLAGCDEARVSEAAGPDGTLWLSRTNRFGDVEVEDRVLLQAPDRVEIHVSESENWPRSWLTILLASEGDTVRLTFSYEQENPRPMENPAFEKLRNEAYRNKDGTLVQLIRQRAAS